METNQASKWQTPFFTIWTAQAFSLFGSMLVRFSLVWWLTETTGSATMLAMATLAAMLPDVLLAPLAGVLVDRWNRRMVMIAADGLVALATIVLMLLYAAGVMQPWHVFVIMLLRSSLGNFHWPAMQASTSLMVPEEHLSRVAGINQALRGGLNIIAPPLGALLLAAMPLHAVLAIDVGTAALAILCLLPVYIPQPKRKTATTATEPKPSLWVDMQEGFQYMWSWPGLLALGVMAMALNFLLTPTFSLLPLLVIDHFGEGALQLGWLEAAMGIGVVLGGLTLGAWGGFRRRIFTTLTALVGMGVGVILLGLTPASVFWLALLAMFVGGFMNPLANGPLHAIMQAAVTPEMQGRVFSLISSASVLMTPLSLVVAGPLADQLGVRIWYGISGAACVLMGVGAFFIPVIVNVEQNGQETQVEPERLVTDAGPV